MDLQCTINILNFDFFSKNIFYFIVYWFSGGNVNSLYKTDKAFVSLSFSFFVYLKEIISLLEKSQSTIHL